MTTRQRASFVQKCVGGRGRTTVGELRAPPYTLARLRGPSSKGEGRGGRGGKRYPHFLEKVTPLPVGRSVVVLDWQLERLWAGVWMDGLLRGADMPANSDITQLGDTCTENCQSVDRDPLLVY